MGEGTESACGASLLPKLHFRVPLLRRILAHPKYGMCLLSVCVLMRVHVRVPECSAHRGQKRSFDHLELEHQILVLCKGSAELSLQPHGTEDVIRKVPLSWRAPVLEKGIEENKIIKEITLQRSKTKWVREWSNLGAFRRKGCGKN